MSLEGGGWTVAALFFKSEECGPTVSRNTEVIMVLKMRKFLVLVDNYGFRGRYWTKDTVVEFPEDVTPDKRQFELITKNTVMPEGADIQKPMNTFADAMARPFKKEPTAGEVFKDQLHPGEKPLSERDRVLINTPGNDL
jgi:hypothetical protein